MRIILDVDGTLTRNGSGEGYADRAPRDYVVAKVRAARAAGHKIILYSARNMRTHSGDIGTINHRTLPILLEWLARHDIPFDFIHMGKPWCGNDGFYVSAHGKRPSEWAAEPDGSQ
ncbi:capsular biosynthesis protein [Sphingomicrobium sp. XHP0239]|uniref:capsular biosynthesis protein n=1 Tax=Sphingomicrobium maritimum TaxID=3133972 RepID=UPI0031CC62F4